MFLSWLFLGRTHCDLSAGRQWGLWWALMGWAEILDGHKAGGKAGLFFPAPELAFVITGKLITREITERNILLIVFIWGIWFCFWRNSCVLLLELWMAGATAIVAINRRSFLTSGMFVELCLLWAGFLRDWTQWLMPRLRSHLLNDWGDWRQGLTLDDELHNYNRAHLTEIINRTNYF